MPQDSRTGPHDPGDLHFAGLPLSESDAAVLLLHGRGATAESILELRHALRFDQVTYVAPQASGNTWYPYSFLAPLQQNEPYLASALETVDVVVKTIKDSGIPNERIVLAGFSQGACLAAEFAARNPARYGGIVVFSGGLIGPEGKTFDYTGDFLQTPVFLGCSDRDFHIPRARVAESAEVFTKLGADVTEKIYPDMGHTVIQDEIDHAVEIIGRIFARSVSRD